MKLRFPLIIAIGLFICSCNNIPDKSVFEPLDTKTLASIIKQDTLFISFYEELQEKTNKFNEIEKAKFNDITYRKLYSMIEFSRDTSKLNPMRKQWWQEWDDKFGMYEAKADSVISYWIQYKKDNSLDQFVKIEFSAIDKEYYTYSHDVKNVNFAFKLTPLKGKIDQIRFNYRYTAKINDVQYAEKHNCISTAPFSSTVTRYWEAKYPDERKLKYTTSSEFIRDYDIVFEITEIRKNGINYDIDDLNIPDSVESLFETDSVKYPSLYKLRKNIVITDLLCPDYKDRYAFVYEQFNSLLHKNFAKEALFMDYADDK